MHSCSCYNYKSHHVVKAGFLRRFKKSFLSKGFKVVYAEVSKDGYLFWYRSQYSHRAEGAVDLKEVCDFLAVGPYTKSIPSRIILPKSVPERNLVAVPTSASRESPVHWFLCANDLDLNQWIMVMNYVLLTQKNVAMPILDSKPSDVVTKDDKTTSATTQESSKDASIDHSLYESIKSLTTYSSLLSTPQKSNSDEEKSKRTQSSRTLLTTTHNGSLVPIPPPPTTKTSHLSEWGWLWGCGMGWGVEGWHAHEFLPSVGSELKMEDFKEALEAGTNSNLNHNIHCDLSEQTFDDYDCAEFESGFNDVGFDSSIDGGGLFDAGFSLGF